MDFRSRDEDLMDQFKEEVAKYSRKERQRDVNAERVTMKSVLRGLIREWIDERLEQAS